MKSIAIIFNKAPYGSQSSRELLDIALMAAAFDMPIRAVFTGDGVYQLLNNQQPESLEIKNHSPTFKAMELYGIEDVFIDKNSLDERELSSSQLMSIGKIAEKAEIKQQFAQSDFVMSL